MSIRYRFDMNGVLLAFSKDEKMSLFWKSGWVEQFFSKNISFLTRDKYSYNYLIFIYIYNNFSF